MPWEDNNPHNVTAICLKSIKYWNERDSFKKILRGGEKYIVFIQLKDSNSALFYWILSACSNPYSCPAHIISVKFGWTFRFH